MATTSIGVDIGGTNTVIGIVGENGTVLQRECFSTRENADGSAYCQRLANEIQKVLEVLNAGPCAGIGIGAPNGS